MTETRDTKKREADDRRNDVDAATRVKPADAPRDDEATRIDAARGKDTGDRHEVEATRLQPDSGSESTSGNDATRVQPSGGSDGPGETEVLDSDPGTEVLDDASLEQEPEQGSEQARELSQEQSREQAQPRQQAQPSERSSTGTGSSQAIGSLGVGSMLRERFRIESVLGEGGMGTVFGAVDLLKQEARDEQVHVALKVMKPDIVDAELTFMGLQREARRAQQLAHPNIVTVYDFDRADGHIYMTMEYLRGQALSDLLKKNRHGLDPEQARDITKQIGAGLAYAHAEGIVHVDLKPQNLFLLDSGRVKILDFGIAKAYQEKRQDRVETAFSGYSPAFASPQIIRRERPTPRDDVFALGIVVYALFTGTHPFDWKSAEQAEAEGVRPAKSAVFKRSEWRAIQAALAFDADARPADAGEFVRQFAPPRIKRTALAVSAASVVAALAFVLLFQPAPGPEVPFDQLQPELQARIVSELADAAAFSELGDLDSALQIYQSVLTLHPGNLQANEGMNETVERSLERIDRLGREGSLSPAAARANMEAMLAYESLPARARERVERAAREL